MFKKIKFYKGLIIELIETMCSICLFLERDAYNCRRPEFANHFRSHFHELKKYSLKLRGKPDEEVEGWNEFFK